VTRDGQEAELRGKGRHDPCVLPRAVPMVESMVALCLVDALMSQNAQCNTIQLDGGQMPNPLGKTAKVEGFDGVVKKKETTRYNVGLNVNEE
jgi:chorismate synthase